MQKEKINRKDKGFTLIALVITIIVMLILVGVSVTVALNGGLFTTAKEAAKNTEIETDKDITLSNGQIEVGGKKYSSMKDYVNGIEKILDDSLPENEYLKTFITEWTVAAGDTITLPIYEMEAEDETRGEVETYFNYNFTVDYGDGTIAEITSFDDADRTHTYENAGIYKIKIDGQCEGWSFAYIADSVEKITKLEQWGVVGAKHIDFRGCTNLTGEIPVPSLNSFNEVESFRRLFYGCTNLTSTIPSNLFENATKVRTLMNVFDQSGVTGIIPEDLLTNCTEVTNVNRMFACTDGLTGTIPENLFSSCKKLIYANYVFVECSNLVGNIPGNLFEGCTDLISVEYLFSGCTGLSGSIPEELFKDCTLLQDVNSVFRGCLGLTGSVPSNLFTDKSELLRIKWCFEGCTNLGDSEIRVDSLKLDYNWAHQMFEGVNANIIIYVPQEKNTTALEKISSTANITIIEYDLE